MVDDAASRTKKLGEILVASGAVGKEDLAAALAVQTPGARLASELFRLGITSERPLAEALAEQLGHPAVVLSQSKLDLAALDLVPKVIAAQHVLLGIAVDPDTLWVAVADIAGRRAERRPIFDQLEFASGRRVEALLAVETVLHEAIKVAYDAERAGEAFLTGASRDPDGSEPLLVVVRPHVVATPPIPEEGAASVPGAEAYLDLEDAPILMGAELITETGDKPIVLIVEDEEDIRSLLRRILAHDGYEIIETKTGKEALDVLRTTRPALILLDAMLPEVHGFDICRTIKASPAFEGTPVVMVSAVYKGWENARTIQEVHKADAFVEKPFDVVYLRQLCARLVGRDLPRTQLAPDWKKKVQALYDEANVNYRMGDHAAAEEAIKKWRALDPFDANLYLLLGNVKTKQGDPDGAMKAYERAATFDSSFYPAFKNLAVVYEQLGFRTRAFQSWYRAYELAPDADTRKRIEERIAGRYGQML